MNKRDEYYSRVIPIVGDKLFTKSISVHNAPFVSKALELLVSCGIVQLRFSDCTQSSSFMKNVWGISASLENFEDAFKYQLVKHNQYEDRWKFSFDRSLSSGDIILCGGTDESCRRAYADGQHYGVPVVMGMILGGGMSVVHVSFPGDDFPEFINEIVSDDLSEYRYVDWLDLNNQMANITRAILLDGSECSRSDVMSVLRSEKRTVVLAHPSWPWVNSYIDVTTSSGQGELDDLLRASGVAYKQTSLRGKTVLIVGIGSLGSITADSLRVLGANVVGVDAGSVSLFNPIRQLYSTEHIDMQKGDAMQSILRQRSAYPKASYLGYTANIADSDHGEAQFEALLAMYQPDAVLLTTAHQAEYRMANVARKRGIPHVVARCYRRARWYEVTAVDPERGPCFGCLQGHLYTGKNPATLTEEQLARYDDSQQQDGPVQAEPATAIDSGRAADSATRLIAALMLGRSMLPDWLDRMFDTDRTCIIGGNHTEYNDEEEGWSFGIVSPGATALYGIRNFIGSETETTAQCLYCGKVHDILIHRKSDYEPIDFEV